MTNFWKYVSKECSPSTNGWGAGSTVLPPVVEIEAQSRTVAEGKEARQEIAPESPYGLPILQSLERSGRDPLPALRAPLACFLSASRSRDISADVGGGSGIGIFAGWPSDARCSAAGTGSRTGDAAWGGDAAGFGKRASAVPEHAFPDFGSESKGRADSHARHRESVGSREAWHGARGCGVGFPRRSIARCSIACCSIARCGPNLEGKPALGFAAIPVRQFRHLNGYACAGHGGGDGYLL